MPSADQKKTKLERKTGVRKKWVGIVVVALLAASVGLVLLQVTQRESRLRINNNAFSTTILTTSDQLQKGLSGTDSLPAQQAMLFVFPDDKQWGIWMKDMNYPIDIVWLDSDRRVVYLVKDAKPSSYPDTTFMPEKPSRYVIELASGTIERTGIKIGDQADLPSGV